MAQQAGEPERDTELEAFAREFHGHLGPWLALGIRMGEYALKTLGLEKHSGLRILARCRPAQPICCLLDGLQISTGCTMGKHTIWLEARSTSAAERATARFIAEGGRTLTLRVRTALPEQLAEMLATDPSELGWERVMKLPADELFREIAS